MAYKPDFVQAEAFDDHSSGRTVADTLLQPPEPAGAKAAPARRPRGSYLVLLQAGLAIPVMLPSPWWALTPPFHLFPSEDR